MTVLLMLIANAVAKSKDESKIPFKLYRNHLVVVTGKLGHLQNRNLLIDTGASPTVVDEALAYELGLNPTGRPATGMNVLGGVVAGYYSVLQSLELGPIHRELLPVTVENLSLMQAQAGVRIDAIVGLDAIQPENFQIDYDSRKIKFGRIRFSSAVPMLNPGPLVTVATQVNGTAVSLLVDTGASEIVLFRNGLPDTITTLPVQRKMELSNVAGDVEVARIQLSEFRVGRADFGGSTAVLATTPPCCDFHGLLGITEARVRRLSFDFEKRLVGIETPDHDDTSMLGKGSCEMTFTGNSCAPAFSPQPR